MVGKRNKTLSLQHTFLVVLGIINDITHAYYTHIVLSNSTIVCHELPEAIFANKRLASTAGNDCNYCGSGSTWLDITETFEVN